MTAALLKAKILKFPQIKLNKIKNRRRREKEKKEARAISAQGR